MRVRLDCSSAFLCGATNCNGSALANGLFIQTTISGVTKALAMAHASGPQTVPPVQPFALDDTPLGTNDFRSTKRNFVFASLMDKEGYGIGIRSCRHAARASLSG